MPSPTTNTEINYIINILFPSLRQTTPKIIRVKRHPSVVDIYECYKSTTLLLLKRGSEGNITVWVPL